MQTIFTPNDIIDITFMLLARRNPMLAGHVVYVPFLIDYLNKQRQKYLDSFHRLIYEHLKKYDRRFRIEPGFELPEYSRNISFGQMLATMKKTFRSDMEQKNVVWEKLVESLDELERLIIRKESIDKALSLFDRIHNAIHNTQTSIFDKFDNSAEILEALDFCFTASPVEYKTRISQKAKNVFTEKKLDFYSFFKSILNESGELKPGKFGWISPNETIYEYNRYFEDRNHFTVAIADGLIDPEDYNIENGRDPSHQIDDNDSDDIINYMFSRGWTAFITDTEYTRVPNCIIIRTAKNAEWIKNLLRKCSQKFVEIDTMARAHIMPINHWFGEIDTFLKYGFNGKQLVESVKSDKFS